MDREMDAKELAKQYALAVSDLEDAVRGHLGGGDWDREMIEAIGWMEELREKRGGQ